MLYLELAIILALVLINGLLAMAELAVVSSRRARLQALVDRDVVGSRRALALADDPDCPGRSVCARICEFAMDRREAIPAVADLGHH